MCGDDHNSMAMRGDEHPNHEENRTDRQETASDRPLAMSAPLARGSEYLFRLFEPTWFHRLDSVQHRLDGRTQAPRPLRAAPLQ
jgi:hypothetical protein